ncbi:DUF7680 family protein [Selenomonas ruminantium]|uniref:DUF7680 domain-containing protein n=1 Tax=Selenomonas ruminantium TaxID=971 RepID=A0A1H0MQS4_SELRU|nr:hypothetical protein [Selenomonas ruminantium]SDO82646.1 hypothetical protein SAMN05216366_1024 [Selenomonas ruminantium]
MSDLSKRQAEIIRTVEPLLKSSPWVMRITVRKDYTGPVLVLSERYSTEKKTEKLREYGCIYNGALRYCRKAIQIMLSEVTDEAGRSLGLDELIDDKIVYRGNLPLNETIGAKLALLAKLHPQVRRADRLELMAWRIERFTREETLYWLTKVSVPTYGRRGIEWAKSGLRLMLAGRQDDKKVIQDILDKIRK